MSKKQPIEPETKDPIKEAIDHPDGPGLDEMIYGKEEENKFPNQNEIESDIRKLKNYKEDNNITAN
jgi:hypothetical protein